MDIIESMKKYAELIVKSGANVQKEQDVIINSPIFCAEFARMVAEEAYKAGAKEVMVNWSDEKLERIRYMNSPLEVFEYVHPWTADRLNYHGERDTAFIYIEASDPDALLGVDPKKPAARRKATYAKTKPFNKALDNGKRAWCIAAHPSIEWAKKVFPELSEQQAADKLWEYILKAVRVDTKDPIEAWENHKQSFAKKLEYLNEKQFTAFHYKNSLGTDLTVGMTENHIWEGGGATLQNGNYYFPNMPTEEIFCTPHRDKINGTVKNALPLSYQGNIIDGFSITYKDGRVVDYSAEKGYDTLKALIETDEGSKTLGELALIPVDSPISKMGTLFYNTLFDENASCHLAIGMGFPTCIKGGTEMDTDTLKAHGVNDSATHVDFMIGTKDLSITATDRDGKEIAVFENGNWAKGFAE